MCRCFPVPKRLDRVRWGDGWFQRQPATLLLRYHPPHSKSYLSYKSVSVISLPLPPTKKKDLRLLLRKKIQNTKERMNGLKFTLNREAGLAGTSEGVQWFWTLLQVKISKATFRNYWWLSDRESAMQVQCLSQGDPLEKEMATHSRIPAWEIPWT